jgi:hypothetical protein
MDNIGTNSVSHGSSDECIICLDEYTEEFESITLQCNHRFHLKCIRSLILSGRKTCPLCRSNIGIDLPEINQESTETIHNIDIDETIEQSNITNEEIFIGALAIIIIAGSFLFIIVMSIVAFKRSDSIEDKPLI